MDNINEQLRVEREMLQAWIETSTLLSAPRREALMALYLDGGEAHHLIEHHCIAEEIENMRRGGMFDEDEENGG